MAKYEPSLSVVVGHTPGPWARDGDYGDWPRCSGGQPHMANFFHGQILHLFCFFVCLSALVDVELRSI